MLRVMLIIAIALSVIHLILRYDRYQTVKHKKTDHSVATKPRQLINARAKQLELEPFAISPKTNRNHIEWTHELLLSLEWKRYEAVCQAWLLANGHQAQLSAIGADGGIDINIIDHNGKTIAIAQCKAWQQKVGVSAVREFYGVMASEGIRQGYYFTTSQFTADAILFSNNKNIALITGNYLIKQINKLSADEKIQLYQLATHGDYRTPTCPRCDIKMRKRESEKGAFWGCANYPKCKNTLNIRVKQPAHSA